MTGPRSHITNCRAFQTFPNLHTSGTMRNPMRNPPFVDIVKFAMRGLRARMKPHPRGQIFAVLAVMISMTVQAAVTGHALLDTEAPDFALRAFVGQNVRLSEHRGDVIVLTFWSSTCAQCGAQLSALDRSFKTYQSAGLQIYGISVDDNAARAKEFAKAHAVGFTLLADPDKEVSRAYRVDNLPMVVLVDRNGTVRYVHRDFGSKGEALYLQQLRTLLNE
jgi:peroxiredoxin